MMGMGDLLNPCKTDAAAKISTNEVQDMDITAADNAGNGNSNSSTTSVRKMLDEVSIMFEERTAYIRKFLDDFSQPLFMSLVDDDQTESSVDVDDWGDEAETIVIESPSWYPKTDSETECRLPPTKIYHNDVGNTSISHSETPSSSNGKGMTHFCFLVHGYNGKPADLLYLRSVMVQLAQEKLLSGKISGQSGDNENRHQHISTSNQEVAHRIVMHTCHSNWKRTHDGVEKGGERIVEEILSVIRNNVPVREDIDNDIGIDDGHDRITNASRIEIRQKEVVDITVSLVGNSLGGLYSRYAIARLAAMSEVEIEIEQESPNQSQNGDSTSTKNEQRVLSLMGGKLRVHFNVFCTTATPHLGVSGHTWIPIPRNAEIRIGKIMGQTGKDIFRISELIKTMCTSPAYLIPLGCFRKRIAYANAYQTDFVVPMQTAAFLNADSTYPHHLTPACEGAEEEAQRDEMDTETNRRNSKGNSNCRKERRNEYQSTSNSHGNKMVVATLHTPQGGGLLDVAKDEDAKTTKRSFLRGRSQASDHRKEMLEMSNSMDRLGWKKVIVDLREQMPVSFRLPRIPSLMKRSTGNDSSIAQESSMNSDSSYSGEESASTSIYSSIHSADNNVVESRDVASAYSTPEDVIAFPLGHNTMVAVEKSIYTSRVFKGGRPLMDNLAKELLEEILTGWNHIGK